ncbi:MAG: MBL fold metallo-hydrolase [Chloroflexota bacterium]
MRLHDRIYLVGSGEMGLSDAWDCHVYLIDGGDSLALIDAGGGRPASFTRIEETIKADGFDPQRIQHLLLTHWHNDHARGAAAWRSRLEVSVYLPENERTYLEQGQAGGIPCVVDRGLNHQDQIQIGDLTIQVIQVPGHSPGICAYLLDLAGYRVLFGADIVFVHGLLGLINYEGSSMAAYRQYLPRLADLNIDALLPGHLLFTLRHGQRHIDLALERLQEMFIPPSIGQLGLTFRPPDDY